MSENITSVALCPQWEYVVPTNVGVYDQQCGEKVAFPDVDTVAGLVTNNSDGYRKAILVKNGSGGNLSPGAALNWVTGFWGTQVQNCPIGSAIRCFVPSYIRGSVSTVVPNGAYFYAVYEGYMSPLSDATAIAIDNSIACVGVAGRVGVNYGVGGGEVFSQVVASTAVASTNVATKFDQNYTFPASSLRAGDTIHVVGQALVTAAVSTDTLTLQLLIGATVVATTGAIDVATNDVFEFISDIVVRTAGASGTIVATTIVNTATGSLTFKPIVLASTAIDTTATQQIAIQATWSTNNANSARQDVMNITRLNATGVGLGGTGGGLAIAAAAVGSQIQFRAAVRCTW